MTKLIHSGEFMSIFYIIVLIGLCYKSSAYLVEKPHNVVGKEGDSIQLNCAASSADDNIYWYRVFPTYNHITDGDVSFDSAYEIVSTYPAQRNLKISIADMAHAGRYNCSIKGSNFNEQATAEVVVVGREMLCSNNVTDMTVVEGEYVSFTCLLTYNGFATPMMQWLSFGRPANGSVNGSTSGQAVYSLMFQAWPDHNNKKYSCQTYYHAATALTPVTETYVTQPLTVHYKPKGLSLSKPSKEYYSGDEITINAMANPVAQYMWQDVTSGDNLTHDATLLIQDLSIGEYHLRAVAWNEIGTDWMPLNFTVAMTTTTTTATTPTTPSTTSSMTTAGSGGSSTAGNDPSDSSLGIGAIIGIIVGVIAIILIIVVIVCLVKRRRAESDPDGPYNIKLDRPAREKMHGDQVRHPDVVYPNHPPPQYSIKDEGPPDNLEYQNLALDDTPRSRKPILTFEPPPSSTTTNDYMPGTNSTMYENY